MVHHRINERESNPNPHINFITALPVQDDSEQEAARQLLRALAAQVRPLMKSHGFSVNSFEEYEHNSVFAGRNWNAGETVELVLRRPDGTFLPTFWLMSTFCHELAHIKHMNHSSDFQTLWRQLRTEVRALQDKGYYGDGYWSSGQRLADSSRIGGQGIEPGDLPEYMCGGAQTRKPSTVTKRRRTYKPRDTTITASNKSGRQTAKRRKAGTRITSQSAFTGEGTTLAEGEIGGKGKGFGKQAASKRAREERALAIEQRISALQNQAKASTSQISTTPDLPFSLASESDEDKDLETDSERRQTLFSSEENEILQNLKSGSLWGSFKKDFNFSTSRDSPPWGGADQECDLPSYSGSTGTSGQHKRKQHPDNDLPSSKKPSKPETTPTPLGIGKFVQSEIDLRRKESLGMAPVRGGGRTLGTKSPQVHNPAEFHEKGTGTQQWTCLVCTLRNEAGHLACSACTTPRGDKIWSQK